MLYFCFKPQIEPLDMSELRLSFIPSVVIEHVTECHYLSCSITYLIMNPVNYFYLLNQSNHFQSFELVISFSILNRLNSFQLFESISLTWFNFFDSDVIHFNFCMEDGQKRSQSHSVEYDWLGPELMLDTRGRYIPIFPVALITPTLYNPNHMFYLDLIWYHIIYLLSGGYYNMYMLPCSE